MMKFMLIVFNPGGLVKNNQYLMSSLVVQVTMFCRTTAMKAIVFEVIRNGTPGEVYFTNFVPFTFHDILSSS